MNIAAQRITIKLREGILYRAGQLYYFFAVSFILFAFYTQRILAVNDPSVTPWANLWPRLLINILPFLLLGYWLQHSFKRPTLTKILIAFFAFPILTSLGACIYIWPQIAQGHMDVFYSVNATNVYAVSMWFIFLGPTLGYASTLLVGFWGLFFMPLFFVLTKGQASKEVLSVFFNDAGMSSAVNIYCAYISSKLRVKMIKEDLYNQDATKKFLGKRISAAIFDNRSDLLKEHTVDSLILALDLRGYSKFILTNSGELAASLMDGYHAFVADAVAKFGGHIHKTAGDGHIISFGLMDEVDLEDIGIPEPDQKRSKFNRKASLLSSAIKCFDDINQHLDEVLKKSGVGETLKLAGGLDYGKVTLKLIGSEAARLEYDIQGTTVIRAARLEAFSKIFFEGLTIFKSALIISPDAVEGTEPKEALEKVILDRHKLRNFESLTHVYVHCAKADGLESAA